MVQVELFGKNLILSFRKRKRLDIQIKNNVKEIFNKYIDRNDIDNFIIDLKGIEFIDSFSFFMLLGFNMQLEDSNKRFFISNVTAELDDLMRYMKLENVFKVIDIKTIKSKTAA